MFKRVKLIMPSYLILC